MKQNAAECISQINVKYSNVFVADSAKFWLSIYIHLHGVCLLGFLLSHWDSLCENVQHMIYL